MAILVVGGTGTRVSSAAAPPADRAVQIAALTVSANYAQSHTIYGFGGYTNCPRACNLLFRSTDGGGSWSRTQPAGWPGGPITSVPDRRDVLVTPSTDGLAVSVDRGDHWLTTRGPTGFVSAGAGASVSPQVIVSTQGHGQYVFDVRARRYRAIPGSSLGQARLFFKPTWKGGPSAPSAFAVGVDPSTHQQAFQACDRRFACGVSHLVAGAEAITAVYPSPRFDLDHTVFLTSTTQLFRSGDGGQSFAAVPLPARSDALIATPQAAVFGPDFDAVRRTGTMYVALLSALSTSGGGGRLSGQVLASSDVGRTWRSVADGSVLDGGIRSLAGAPDGRLFAAYFTQVGGVLSNGLVCAPSPVRSWRPACSPYEQVGRPRGPPVGTSAPAAGSGEVLVPAATGAPHRGEQRLDGVPRSVARKTARSPLFGWGIAVVGVAFSTLVLRAIRRRGRARLT